MQEKANARLRELAPWPVAVFTQPSLFLHNCNVMLAHLEEPRPRLPPHLPLLAADLAQPHRLHVALPADAARDGDGAAHVQPGGGVRKARQVAQQGRGRRRGEVPAAVVAAAAAAEGASVRGNFEFSLATSSGPCKRLFLGCVTRPLRPEMSHAT